LIPIQEEEAGMPQRLIVVDDDPSLCKLLHSYLSEAGYEAVTVGDGDAMRRATLAAPVDAIILDVMLPGEDGLSLCKWVRARTLTPILMLTARDDPIDRVLGLELGADDYLCKPFHPRELLVRIRNMLRHSSAAGDRATAAARSQIRFSEWCLDLRAHCLYDPAGTMVTLSTGEFRLLRALGENLNCVLSRDQLIDALSGRDASAFDRSVDVLVSRLRRRLRDDAREPRLIKTVRNEGYMLSSRNDMQGSQ
jgi:two-component system OmpR family response regulator